MKRLKYILPIIIIAVMLGGCPYKSDIPLDTTGKKINPAFLGTWEPKSSENEKYKVTKSNDFTYRIVKTSKSSKDSSVYLGYVVDVDGDAFLNLQEQGEMADKGYYFYKVSVNESGSKVTLSSVTENITEKFTTGADMKAFFKKYKGLSFFYDKTQDVYIKD